MAGSGPHYLAPFFCMALGRAVCFPDFSFLFCKIRVGPLTLDDLTLDVTCPALSLLQLCTWPWISLWNFSTQQLLYLCILPSSSRKTFWIK